MFQSKNEVGRQKNAHEPNRSSPTMQPSTYIIFGLAELSSSSIARLLILCKFKISKLNEFLMITLNSYYMLSGAQWLSGRVLESERVRVRASLAVTAIWSLSKTHLSYLSTGSTQEDRPCLTEKLLMGRKESNQTKIYALT